jgi:hypothetical protein
LIWAHLFEYLCILIAPDYAPFYAALKGGASHAEERMWLAYFFTPTYIVLVFLTAYFYSEYKERQKTISNN